MAGETVTRARLSEAVYQEVGLSRNESAGLVESVIAEISGALERGEIVKISSFGSFAVRQKGQRIGRNPKTFAILTNQLRCNHLNVGLLGQDSGDGLPQETITA